MQSIKVVQGLTFISIILPFSLNSDWDYKFHDGNNIKCWTSNFGIIAQDSSQIPGCEWPKGSGHNYIFGGGLWYGFKRELKPNLWQYIVTTAYHPNTGYGECVPGLVRQGTTAYYNPYVRVYLYPEDWPPPIDTFPMAPQVPLTFEDSWCCYNDYDSSFHFPEGPFKGGKPLGIEVYQSGYADPRCPDAIFFRYTIKNCTTYTIENSIVGVCIDYDIGESGDDCAGCIYDRWFYEGADSFYIYCLPFGYDCDWQVPGWDTVGVVGVLMVEAPDQLPLLTSLSFIREIDPNNDYEAYRFLEAGICTTGNSPDDRRLLLAVGPLSLNPGDSKNFGIAVVFALATLEDTLPLALTAKRAREFYWQNIVVEEAVSRRLGTEWGRTITTGEVIVGEAEAVAIFDVSGRLVRMINRPHRVIQLESLPPGIYFLKIKTPSEIKTEKLVVVR